MLEGNSLNKSNRICVAKFLIVLSGVLLAFTALGFPTITAYLGYTIEAIEITWLVLWILSLISCFFMILSISSVNLGKEKEAEVMQLFFKTYGDFKEYFSQALDENGFKTCHVVSTSPAEEVTVYIKNTKPWMLDCVSIIRILELNGTDLCTTNDLITRMLTTLVNEKVHHSTVNMISIFCVDRLSPAFRTLMNSSVQQGFKNGRLVVGISFGGKKMYIAHPRNRLGIVRYNRLRKILFEITRRGKTGGGLRAGHRTGDGSLS